MQVVSEREFSPVILLAFFKRRLKFFYHTMIVSGKIDIAESSLDAGGRRRVNQASRHGRLIITTGMKKKWCRYYYITTDFLLCQLLLTGWPALGSSSGY